MMNQYQPITLHKFLEYIPDDIITRNEISTVYKAQHKQWGTVVLKKFNGHIPLQECCTLKKEAEILVKLRFPNIVTFVGIVCDDNVYGLILEYMIFGPIIDFITNYKINWIMQINMINDIILGMNYLHSLNPSVIHGDLNPCNILVGDGGKAKITNFGLAIWKEKTQSFSTNKIIDNSQTIIAPEVWNSNCSTPDKNYDVFAFAISCWQILTQNSQFNIQGEDISIGKRPDLSLINSDIPKELSSLIKKCWVSDPKKRPKFTDIKRKMDSIRNNNPHLKYLPNIDSNGKNFLVYDNQIYCKNDLSNVSETSSNKEDMYTIIRNYITIMNHIDVGKSVDYLYQKNILLDSEMQEIRNLMKNSSRVKAARKLMNFVFKFKKPQCFQYMLESIESYAPYLKNTFTKNNNDNEMLKKCELTEQKIRHRIVDNYSEFVTGFDPDDILDHLIQFEVISFEERQHILSPENLRDSCAKLFDVLLSGNKDNAFRALWTAFADNYSHMHNILMNN